MTLSQRSIDAFKKRSEDEIWNYLSALQHLQNVLFQLEKNESDPEVLRDIAGRALEIGKEISSILELLEEIIDDEED